MNKKPLKIALAQLNYKLNDFAGNVAKIKAAIEKAKDADLIVFTELALSGYYPQDLVEEPDFLERQAEAISAVKCASMGIRGTIVIGAATPNRGVGKPLFNSLLLVQDGQVSLAYSKQLLPTYGIFDERRHFEPGQSGRPAIVDINGHKAGFLICEDGWNDEEKDYAANPVRELAEAGAEILVSINASPSNVGKEEQRHGIFTRVAAKYAIPVVYVNQVGGNDQLVFDGASFIAHPTDGIVFRLPGFTEAVETVGYDGERFALTDAQKAAGLDTVRYMGDGEFYYNQIVLGLRDYVQKVGFKSAVVGSSGGIDSALTLALARDALGAENVKAITMPSRFSSGGSVSDSEVLCRNLGVELMTHEIASLYDSYMAGFSQSFGQPAAKLTKENVQARIRGAILMEYSNEFGNLLLTTGNKSEISVGYFTLYGDSNGGINLIGDLYKTEVFALARYYNERHGQELIPNAIIDKAPSAELSEGQVDTDSLPPYPVLDEILKFYIEGPRLRADEYARAKAFVENLRAGGQVEVVSKVLNLVKRSEFKRRQAPPIIRVRNRAFGNGRQIPIAAA